MREVIDNDKTVTQSDHMSLPQHIENQLHRFLEQGLSIEKIAVVLRLNPSAVEEAKRKKEMQKQDDR